MLSTQLDKTRKELERMQRQTQGGDRWSRQALDRLNGALRQVLADVGMQVRHWQHELEAREELQARLLDAPSSSKQTQQLWWDEQLDFYDGLIGRIDRSLCFNEDARVTVSLNAQEILLLVRLMVEEGIIHTETLRPIFRYLSQYVGTHTHRRLSFDSLKKRYSLRHVGADKHVRQRLLNMLKRLDNRLPDS
ncbi:hypothetical protein [Parapedobacter sp. 10938]|uniref:hypothetical protein n=1 Tax=Parapedobacter flavus TaxID=3110225 RepID=UPI002DBDF811|nr:hypothetical protein [Parapedobacter sp. 10938]MEC3879743.1 hypothetical protein [Parapedobacter sp. 10938]